MTHVYHRSKKHGEPDSLPEPTKWADAITADHKILNEEDASREEDRIALIILDRFTSWLQAYACQHKSADETYAAFQRFLGPKTKAEHI